MKVIFLDFDGVLNSTVSFITHKRDVDLGLRDIFARPDASAVTLVNRLILSDPAIRVVISSSWRHGSTTMRLREILVQDFGLSDDAAAMVIDKTPSHARLTSSGFRGHEIDEWLEDNTQHLGVTDYVILDDNSDMTEDQKKRHFVQTDMDNGFTWKDYVKARHILGVPKDGFVVL